MNGRQTRLDKNHFMGHFSVVDDVGAALWLGVFDRLVQRKPHRTARYCCRLLYLSYGIYGDADYGGRVFSRALSVGANRNRTAKVAETKCGDFLLLHAAACVIAFRFTAYSSIYQVKVGSQLVIFAVGIFLGSFFLAPLLHAKQNNIAFLFAATENFLPLSRFSFCHFFSRRLDRCSLK